MGAGDIIVVREDGSGRKGNYFDGVDDYVLHDAHAVQRVSDNDQVGTYTAWIYLGNLIAGSTILSAGDNNSGNEYLQFAITTNERLSVKIVHGGSTQFQTLELVGSMVKNKWCHVAVVQDGVQPKLYVNGLQVATSNTASVDLTFWYDELTLVDKFAIGVLESNNTHTGDFTGAMGQVKYWNVALTDAEILADKNGEDVQASNLQFNVTMEDDGTTDSGLGLDNGTLTGDAHYGGVISDWSYQIAANVTGHAAEDINTVIDGNKYLSVIKRGD